MQPVLRTTLLDLVQAVSEQVHTDANIVATVARLINITVHFPVNSNVHPIVTPLSTEPTPWRQRQSRKEHADMIHT
jgi:hypothetical protein